MIDYKISDVLIINTANVDGEITDASSVDIANNSGTILEGDVITGTGIVGSVTVASISEDAVTVGLSTIQTLANDTLLSFTRADATGYDYLTLSEIKSYLKVDNSSDDDLLITMLNAAASYIERQFKQTLKNRDITIQYDANEKYIDLLFCPMTSITNVTYTSANSNASGTFTESTDYWTYGLTDSRARSLVFDINKSYQTVTIYYNSDGRVVPFEMKLATLAYIKVMYDNNRSFFDKDVPTAPPTETIQLMSPYKPIVI